FTRVITTVWLAIAGKIRTVGLLAGIAVAAIEVFIFVIEIRGAIAERESIVKQPAAIELNTLYHCFLGIAYVDPHRAIKLADLKVLVFGAIKCEIELGPAI